MDYVQHISNLPYFERRLELARINPKRKRFLYKYMSIDPKKEKSADHVRDILVKSRLWLSSPSDFNDPFDMTANMTVSDDPRERRERVKTLLKEMGLSFTEREKRVKKFTIKPVDELTDILASSYRKNITPWRSSYLFTN